MAKNRVAVFGGAFDPPTANHMMGAAEVYHSGLADEVLLVPCGPRPDKPHLSGAVERYVMVQLAVNTAFSPDLPVKVSDVEVLEKEALATYDTLCALRENDPDSDFSFVIGSDWLQAGADLRQWTSKDPVTGEQIVTGHKLVKEFDFLVIPRPGYDVEDLSVFGDRMRWLVMPEGVNMLEGNLSSTEIRKRTDASYQAQKGVQYIEGMVTPAVLSYICRSGLYLKSSGDSPDVLDNMLAVFRTYDENNDGTISVSELSNVLTRLGAASCSEADLQELMDATDLNRDGRIQYEEFLSFILKEDKKPSTSTGAAPSPPGLDRHRSYETPGAGLKRHAVGLQRSLRKKRNVAVFGGAFDPPTISHVMGLAEIVNSGMVDEAVMVPCGPRPDKPQLRPPLIRFTMCEIAVSSTFSPTMPVRVSDLEAFEPEALPTYNALCRLRDADPEANFMFVIGSDWLQPGNDLRKWTSKDEVTGATIVTGEQLVNEFDFLVIKRPGYEVEDVSAFGPRMKWLDMPEGMKRVEANLSSTEVRKRAGLDYRLKSGKLELIDGIVPPAVYSFVKREGIYRPGASCAWRR